MKPETEIRNLRRERERLVKDFNSMVFERDQYKARATKAGQEAAEWKQRFDLLLSKCGLPPASETR